MEMKTEINNVVQARAIAADLDAEWAAATAAFEAQYAPLIAMRKDAHSALEQFETELRNAGLAAYVANGCTSKDVAPGVKIKIMTEVQRSEDTSLVDEYCRENYPGLMVADLKRFDKGVREG